MEAKRQRLDPKPAIVEPQTHRDYYNEVLSSGNDDIGASIRSSWLIDLYWISSVETDHEKQQQNQKDVQLHSSTRSIESSSSSSAPDIRSEIQHNLHRLLLIKRQLKPAAERSAKAFNSHYDDSATTIAAPATDARREFEKARRACNPFEALGEGQNNGLNRFFMNRSAIKLANIDAALGFVLTQRQQKSLVFADLCGAPGGFSEYILWRGCQSLSVCRGYGMSLTGSNDQGNGIHWKLDDVRQEGENGTFSQYRVCYGEDGTGDIYNWENLESLQRIICNDNDDLKDVLDEPQHQEKDRAHVDLFLADGGFDTQRDADNQEEMAQKLVVYEVAAALYLLRKGGTCVIKLFGFQTTVIRDVLSYLFFAFDNFVAIKPISSRPASAERYVVCTGFHGNATDWDGKQWCQQLLSGQRCVHVNDAWRSENSLFRYLDEFDRDLSSLNLKACGAILSYLESRFLQYDTARREDFGSDDDDLELDDAPRINVASYKYAWRLFE